jgi:ATP-dependent helicase/nuclease subunit B
MGTNVFTIPSRAPFAETLAKGVVARFGASPLALAEVTIYLPTRRAARTFGDAFARVLGGSALLPEFRPLGDVDEGEFEFDAVGETLELLPAITPLRRRLLLATLVQRWHAARKRSDLSFTQALAHADGLCKLLDDIETHKADLDTLDDLVEGARLAAHWNEVRDFLLLLRDEWPKILAEENALNPAARRNLALAALADRLKRDPRPTIAAGSTGSIPATANLLAAIAQLPQGAVVLPGLDRSLDDETWARVGNDPGHPQFGLKQLIERLDVTRDEVRDWSESEHLDAREKLLGEVLRPAPTTDAWRRIADTKPAFAGEGLDGLTLVETADPSEEASAIALMLRKTLEKKGETAALITPDRALARRVTAELSRFGVEIDDSAGCPLASTPAGTFLGLLAEAAAAAFAPVPLLALLKHPLVSLGGDRAGFLGRVRALDLELRGPRPDPGLAGVAQHIEKHARLAAWFAMVADVLRPLETQMQSDNASLADIVDAHVAAAERLACDGDGVLQVWAKEAGAAASTLLASLREAADDLLTIEPSSYAPLFRLLAEETPVRPAFGRHPRLSILGPLEARLQSFDLTILGGLNEGTWPRAVAADPWLSRPMREKMGLESPERAIGLSAHDFAGFAARPHVILTRATKADGAQTIAARWLQRLQQFAKGLGVSEALAPRTDWTGIARSLRRVDNIVRLDRPAPKPAVALRPRRLTVTDIEVWRRDPYAIYAEHILKLEPLDPLDAGIGARERGSLVHEALEIFIREFPGELPGNADLRLVEIADGLFRDMDIPPALRAIWRPRFIHAARWFVGEERKQREAITGSIVEIKGALTIVGPGGTFLLEGRADRVDLLKGGGAAIIDYKTGDHPTAPQMESFLAPQLPLEGAMLAEGGFKELAKLVPRELIYVRFSGGAIPGAWDVMGVDAPKLSAEAHAWLAQRVAQYDDAGQGYLSRAIAFRANLRGPYDHLARVGEWVPEPQDEWDP